MLTCHHYLRILAVADPNGFASLVLLNSKWRTVSQRAHLYGYHLARCPSFAASHSSLPRLHDDNLPTLRRLFAREVKRNLFDAYCRPRETTIKLVSNSISSSSCPGGEGLHFGSSPGSQMLLAYNSSRIYVIDVTGEAAEVKRELKILRRPVAACVKDDATLLAVLSTEMQVDVYDLEASPPRRKHAIILDNSPRTIAMSPCGSVLAAAYEGGIEVLSLRPGALASERRSVKCDGVDALAFSNDGTQILGTTTHSQPPCTVILTAPYYDPATLLMDHNLSAMWTTSILFPNTSRDCSHAVLVQDGTQEEASWAFAWDPSFETFRAVRIEDLRNGTTYFTGPVPKATSQAKMLPSILPAATHHGDLVAAGFHSNEVWIYGVPEDLNAVPESNLSVSDRSSGLGRNASDRSSSSRQLSSRGQEPTEGRVPQWQLLCDRLRNTLVAGHKVSDLPGISSATWVANFASASLRERLLVTAKGVSGPRLVTDEEDIDFVDGGRVALLDFDYGICDGKKTEMTIEVGTDNAEVLEEERRDLEAEVAIVRRRTVARQHGNRSAILRVASGGHDPAATAASLPSSPIDASDDDPLLPRRVGQVPTAIASPDAPEDPDVATIEEQEAMDAPYAHGNPRSAPTLRRAATAVAANQRLHPRLADGRPVEYRRADGRREHPHESDADNWVPPPPPYQKDDPGALPAFLRGPAIDVGSAPPVPALPSGLAITERSRGPSDRVMLSPSLASPDGGSSSRGGSSRVFHHQRTASDSTTLSRPRGDRQDGQSEALRPQSSPSHVDAENLYDVTPPTSPRVELQNAQASQPNLPDTPDMTRSTAQSSQLSVSPEAAVSSTSAFAEPLPSRFTLPSINTNVWNPQHVGASGTRSPSHPFDSPAPSGYVPSFPGGQTGGFPYSSPQQNMSTGNLPFLPISSGQFGSAIQQNARRPSENFLSQTPQVSGYNGEAPQSQQVRPVVGLPAASTWNSGPDQPLIISTPGGVTGAFDPPGRRISAARRSETPILAPVPRHPRATHGGGSRPTVERLEGISTGTGSLSAQARQRSRSRRQRHLLRPWRRSPSVSPGMPVGVGRQASRAGRSAALNIQEARKRGWDPQKKKSRRKPQSNEADVASSVGGWTDVSSPSAMRDKNKDKKCVVM